MERLWTLRLIAEQHIVYEIFRDLFYPAELAEHLLPQLIFWSYRRFQVWITGYDSYPSNFYVHDNVYNGSFDRRRYV